MALRTNKRALLPWAKAISLPGLALAAAQLYMLFGGGSQQTLTVLALFVAALAVLSVAEMHLPQGDEVTIDAAAAVAGAFLLPVNQVALFTFLGGFLGASVRGAIASKKPKGALMRPARRAATIFAIAWWGQLCVTWFGEHQVWAKLLIGLVGGLVYMTVDLSVESLLSSRDGRIDLWAELLGRIRMLGSLYIGQVSLGVTAYLLYPRLALWGFAVVILLALILQNAYGLYLRTRAAYAQTINVLADLSEGSRSRDEPPSLRRLADTAVAIGRRLSLSSHMLEAIGYAALLRDIGLVGGEDRALHAERGANILAEIPILKESALLVRLHHTSADELSSQQLPVQIAANILAFCSDYFEREQVADADSDGITAFAAMHQKVGQKYFSAVFWAAAEEILGLPRDELGPLFEKCTRYSGVASVLASNEG